MTRRLPLLLALVIGFLPMTSSAVQAAEVEGGLVGIRLVDAPVERRDDPRAQTAIVDHVPVLTEFERRIELSNTTAEPQAIKLYAAGADATAEGWQVFDGHEQNDLSGMITVDPPEVTVAPGELVTATVTVTVPADAPQREHYAVVWAELPPGDGQVTLINRVGIRLYVSIGNGDEPPSDFMVDTLTAGRNADGDPTVSARVENTGGRALDLGGQLRLDEGPAGLLAGPFQTPRLATLGIGDTSPVVVVLDPSLPAGPWLATMTITSGNIERVVQAELTFPDGPDTEAAPVEATPVRPGGPVGPIVAGLFLLLTLGMIFFVWRRRRQEDDEEPAEAIATA